MEEDIIIGKNIAKKLYLFVFNGWDREDAKKMLDGFLEKGKEVITYWRTDMYNSFYIVSKKPINSIRDAIHSHISSLRFILVEMENCSGWIPSESWDVINKYLSSKKPKLIQETKVIDSYDKEEIEI